MSEFYLKMLIISSTIISFLIVFSFSLIILNHNFYFDFSYTGFNNFITFFKFPISLLAALIAILSLFISIFKSSQTDDNFRFNNYFSHKKEFINYFSFIKPFDKYELITNRSIQNCLMVLHNEFFGKNYKLFNPSIPFENNIKIQQFFQTSINNLSINKISSAQELTHEDTHFPLFENEKLNEFLNEFSKLITEEIFESNQDIQTTVISNETVFNNLTKSVLTHLFLNSVLVIGGQEEKHITSLMNNFIKSCEQMGLINDNIFK